MKNTTQGLKKFIYTGVILFIIIDLYIKIFAQQLDYLYYKLNKANYDVVIAQVMEKKEKTILMGKTEPLLTYTEVIISYRVNGLDYVNRISKYPEVNQLDTIHVAVKNGNEEVRRCVLYVVSERDKKLILYYFFATCIVFKVVDYILILREKISKVSNKNKEERVNIEKDIAKKKDKIRKLCMQLHIGTKKIVLMSKNMKNY